MDIRGVLEGLDCLLLDPLRILLRLGDDLAKREGVAWVVRKGDHRLDSVEVDLYDRIIEGCIARLHLLIILRTLVDLEVLLYDVVGLPDGGQTCGLRGHGVDAVTEIHGHGVDARSDELEDGVLHELVLEGRTDQGEGHIHRADPWLRATVQKHCDDLRVLDLIELTDHGFRKLRTTLTDRNGTLGAVTGVGIGYDRHVAGLDQHLTHILVDDGLVWRNEDAAELMAGGLCVLMYIGIDGTADGCEAVVAVRENGRHRKLLKSRSDGGLQDADIGVVIDTHLIKADLEILHITAVVVCLQHLVAQRLLLRCREVDLRMLRNRRQHIIM